MSTAPASNTKPSTTKVHPITLLEALRVDKKTPAPIGIANTLIEDMKVRDSGLKLVQNVLKLSGMHSDDEKNAKQYDSAAKVVGMGRRLIRFGRWVPFTSNLTKNVFASDTIVIATKAVHHIASIMGCLCEDLTTLDQLKLLQLNENASFFESLQKYSTFTEAVSGLVISVLNLKAEKKRFADLYNGYKKNNSMDKTHLLTSYYNIHNYQMNIIKWACEIISQSAGLPSPLHSNQTLAVLAAIVSSGNTLYCALLRAILQAK